MINCLGGLTHDDAPGETNARQEGDRAEVPREDCRRRLEESVSDEKDGGDSRLFAGIRRQRRRPRAMGVCKVLSLHCQVNLK